MRAALLLFTALPVMAAELPVVSVTLSNAGLAQIERRGAVPANEPVVLRAPTRDVDDLLKSLVVLDPAGTVEGARLPAQDAATEAFRGLPVGPEDFATRVSLLRALRGQQVEAGGFVGRLADAEEVDEGVRIAIITENGLASAIVREGEELRLRDGALARRIRRAADALAAVRTEDQRRIEIALRADRTRDVSLLSVTGAPLWKPSWRLLVPEGRGEARLLGWAVIENRSGTDWEGVRLSLVSGNPAAYRQALYTPIDVPRQEIAVRGAEAVNVRPDTGARPAPPPPPVPAMAAAPMPRSARGAMAEVQRMRDSVAVQPETEMVSSIGRVAFTLPAPVTVRSGETANVPFLDARIPAERIWWVQDLGARNPLLAVRLTNGTGSALPDGIVTVFGTDGAETGAFLGDSELQALPASDSRVLAFGRDRDVHITHAASTTERPVGVELQRGRVVISAVRRDENAFAIDPRGARGKLVIDLPARPGAKPDFAVQAEGDFGLRHEATLDGAPATLRFGFERDTKVELPLWDPGFRPFAALDSWRGFDVEAEAARLPGGPGTLERLRQVLERMPQDAKGRDILASVITDLGDVRGKLDASRAAIRAYLTADAALDRARQAVEDRSGPQKEEARRRLNEASLAADRAGAAADAAWNAWRQAAEKLLARESRS